MFCICQFFFLLIFVINAMMSNDRFLNCLPFLSGYMSVFSIPQRQKWIKQKKTKSKFK